MLDTSGAGSVIRDFGRSNPMSEPGAKRSRNRGRWLLVSVLVLALGAASIHWLNNNLNAQRMARQCQKRVEATVNPTVLQSWAVNLLITGSNTPANRQMPSLKSAWPREEPYVGVRRSGDSSYVEVSWGAGTLRSDCHWGLAVGSPTFVLPQYPGQQSRAWKPGIYFWQGLHRQVQARGPGEIE
jgi:hypothetical protein